MTLLDQILKRWETEESLDLLGEIDSAVHGLHELVTPGCKDCAEHYNAQTLVEADELLEKLNALTTALEHRITTSAAVA
jgi:hypothetical protein